MSKKYYTMAMIAALVSSSAIANASEEDEDEDDEWLNITIWVRVVSI